MPLVSIPASQVFTAYINDPTDNSTVAELSEASGNYTYPYAVAQLQAGSTTSDRYELLARGFLNFDTSSIPANAVITSVELDIFVYNNFAVDLDFGNLVVAKWNTTNPTEKAGAYQELDRTTTYGSVTQSSLTESQFETITLNNSSVVKGGGTNLVLALDYDINKSYTGTFNLDGFVGTWADDTTVPWLTIEYEDYITGVASATIEVQASVTNKAVHRAAINAEIEADASIRFAQNEIQTIEKGFIYKVYEQDGTYIGTWKDVVSDANFSQQINTVGSSLNVTLARSPNYTKTTYSKWVDDTNDQLQTDDSEDYIFPDSALNAVGSGTDVDIGYLVDLYLYYGQLEAWVDDGEDEITDESGDDYVFSVGAPNGRVFFSGYIDTYNLKYGPDGGVDITLLSNGADMSNRIIKSGSNTTVAYNSFDPSNIMKGILDNYGGRMSYSPTSIDLSSTTVSYTFKLNSALEGAEKAVQLAPSGWYWYGDVGENNIYMKGFSDTPDHVFTLGKEISDLELIRTMRNLVNEVYFVGGETAGVPLYKTYSDSTSITSYGRQLRVLTDQRVTNSSTADTISNNLIADNKMPEWQSTITIPDNIYDIYSIKLGQIIGFEGFGTFVDDITAKVTEISYERDSVTLTLGSNIEEQRKRIEDINRNTKDKATENIGTAPS